MSGDVTDVVMRVLETETGVSRDAIDPAGDIRAQVHIDSMQYVSISVAVESALGIELPIEIIRANTLNDFLDIVRAEVAKEPV